MSTFLLCESVLIIILSRKYITSVIIYTSLVLVQPRKACPCLTERLLIGRKESNRTKLINNGSCAPPVVWYSCYMTENC